ARLGDAAQQRVIGDRRRADLDERHAERRDAFHRWLVPARRRPGDAPCAAVPIDLVVLLRVELDAMPVLEVRETPPRRVALAVPLLRWNAQLGRALLELDAVASRRDRAVDEALRHVEGAVVVDADFGDHVHGLAVSDRSPPDGSPATRRIG